MCDRSRKIKVEDGYVHYLLREREIRTTQLRLNIYIGIYVNLYKIWNDIQVSCFENFQIIVIYFLHLPM